MNDDIEIEGFSKAYAWPYGPKILNPLDGELGFVMADGGWFEVEFIYYFPKGVWKILP